MNQVKPSEQVAARVTTVSLSRLVTRPATGNARQRTDAKEGCCDSDGLAVFHMNSLGASLLGGGQDRSTSENHKA